MSKLPKAYDPNDVEKDWYAFWEKNNLFQINPQSSKPPYCIVMPPPNVTGVLHMGHALTSTLQDILIRWKRMMGYETLWIPGTDHAGIATQTVVERDLIAREGKRRHDFSREEFLQKIWKWKEKTEPRIIAQIKKMGCSCDWSRYRFSMDKEANHAVCRVFKLLFDQGLIYRGNYLVNWDPITQTALADDEVEYEERQTYLWTFRYPYADGSGFARIATTRPETMLGDTAVAVAPDDSRYIASVGKTIQLPLIERPIPVIAHLHVNPEFGTGMVKVTPGHDPNDYQIGIDHNLPLINIMTPDGKINTNGGRFSGLTMLEARTAVVEAMDALGLLESVEPYTHRVGISYRSHATIEPYLSKQWFLKMAPFAPKLRAAVGLNRVRLIPKQWENTYFHWIQHLRDWCISRQLWWGHRIPIWYKKDDPETLICYAGEGLPPEVEENPDAWKQEDDVLDTWFSSALWPFSTLGWPEESDTLSAYYPNSALVTGHDILFFWVARMVLMGEYVMEQPPFPEVCLHGLIYGKSYWRKTDHGTIAYVSDEERRQYDLNEKPVPSDVSYRWEKMSKSKGNVIDPMEVCNEYGTDAVRMALCASCPKLPQIDLDRRRFEEFRNFTNKMWNGARFVLHPPRRSHSRTRVCQRAFLPDQFKLEDRWILSKLNTTIHDVNRHLAQFSFDQAAMKAYDFFWKEFCAYYLEIAKPTLFGKIGSPEDRQLKQKLLLILLIQSIRLLHPMAPFITEELFSRLKAQYPSLPSSARDPYTHDALAAFSASACIVAPYPTVIRQGDINPIIEESFSLLEKIVYSIRQIRGEMKIPATHPTDIYLVDAQHSPLLAHVQENASLIPALVRTDHLYIQPHEPDLPFASIAVVETLKIFIPLPPDLLHKEKQRLEKEQQRLQQQLDRLQQQLQNPQFLEKAPPDLVAKQEAAAQKTEQELNEITSKLNNWNDR